MSTIVIMPGGFHPFHAGHADLYQSAVQAFPGAEVFVAATNDTSNRPFPFAIKEKLAKLVGVKPGHFVQVKSPFRAEEITSQFDPDRDRLIFVRSEKDADKPPQAGGVKKDGKPAYLQPLAGQTNIRPFKEHAYMAYFRTVEFLPGMTGASDIRAEWPTLDQQGKINRVMSLYPTTQKNPKLAANVVAMLDTVMGAVDESAMGDLPRPNKRNQFKSLHRLRKQHGLDEQGTAEGEGGLGQVAGIGINGKQFNFSIKDLIAKAQNYPIKKLNPQLFVKQLADRHEDPKQTAARAQSADLQYPIIVVQDGNTLMIADGTHRAQKAIINKLPAINAHVIPVEDMAEFVKQGVAEGIEDNYNKNDAGIKAALQAGVKLIPIQPNNDATGKPIYIHDNSGRYTVAVDMGGISVPFYNSTGLGGKAGVAVDKWYPFFGIGPDGWINKGSEEIINDFYGSNKLKRVAQVLNNTLGLPSRAKNVSGWSVNRGDGNYFISAVNRGLDPAALSDRSTKLRDNMLSVLRGLGEPNKYVEKHTSRPKAYAFDKNNPEHVAAFDATSQSEREIAMALAKDPKSQGVAEEASPMIKPPANRFDNKQEAFDYAKEHGGKVFKSTYIDPNTGIKNITFVVKKEQGMAEGPTADQRAFFAGADSNRQPKWRPDPKTAKLNDIQLIIQKYKKLGADAITQDEYEKLKLYRLGKQLYEKAAVPVVANPDYMEENIKRG